MSFALATGPFVPRAALPFMNKCLRFSVLLSLCGLLWTLSLRAQVTYSDNFNSSLNYLTNGVAGTIWDGVYFGAGEFNNTGLGGGGAGATLQCDATISTAGGGTLATTGPPR